jgi:hypothetical protein
MNALNAKGLLKLVHPEKVAGEQIAQIGALAEIVDGKTRFPEYHYELLANLADMAGRDKEPTKEDIDDLMNDFVCVEWIKEDIRCSNSKDGYYLKARFSAAVADDDGGFAN